MANAYTCKYMYIHIYIQTYIPYICCIHIFYVNKYVHNIHTYIHTVCKLSGPFNVCTYKCIFSTFVLLSVLHPGERQSGPPGRSGDPEHTAVRFFHPPGDSGQSHAERGTRQKQQERQVKSFNCDINNIFISNFVLFF